MLHVSCCAQTLHSFTSVLSSSLLFPTLFCNDVVHSAYLILDGAALPFAEDVNILPHSDMLNPNKIQAPGKKRQPEQKLCSHFRKRYIFLLFLNQGTLSDLTKCLSPMDVGHSS
ncbi:hypothetical protein AB6A40_006916 [Gnathostoma spinigerum]|uniref:Uncharacterized protein n=1 Tax=Gnathostoma spinigerum TaxID=75299 RepID=A0ABD6EU41_9BILA